MTNNRTPRQQLLDITSLAGEIAAGGLADWRAQSIAEMCMKLMPIIDFVEDAAELTADGDLITDDEEEGGSYEYVMENDDAWSAINRLIHEARELLGREVPA